MTDEMQTIRDDIAYLKSLAEAGRDGVETGAWILIAAGGAYAVASAVQWAALTRFAGVTFTISTVAWLVAMAVFFITLFVVKSRQRPGGSDQRTANLGWQGIGWGLFVLFMAIGIATWRTQSPILISFSPSIVMGLYGAAWLVAATVTRRSWLWLTAFGSFAAALVSAWLVNDTVQWLFYSACLLLLAFLPGVVFLMQGRAATRAAVA